jgi:hypothetical protein
MSATAQSSGAKWPYVHLAPAGTCATGNLRSMQSGSNVYIVAPHGPFLKQTTNRND